MAKGYCDGHYQQLRKGTSLVPLQQIRHVCTFPGCEKPHEARGYCYGHYAQHKSGQELRPLTAQPSPIDFDGESWRVALFGKVDGHVGHIVAYARIDEATIPHVKHLRFYRSSSGAHVVHGGPALSRLVLQPPKGSYVRFINKDPLDCRRVNLKVVRPEPCSFPACNRQATALGLCSAHRRQQLRKQRLRSLRSTHSVPYQNAEGTWCTDLFGLFGKHVGTMKFDATDLPIVQAHRWYGTVHKRHVTGVYACTPAKEGRGVWFLHRLVMGLGSMREDRIEVDHISGDTLDNRKENLRLASRGENAQNLGVRHDNTTDYRGVTWDKARNKFRAEFCVHAGRFYIGRFRSKEDAARAVSSAREETMPFTNEARSKRQ